MGDQRNQVIKGSPSQYVKLNVGGKLMEKSEKWAKKINIGSKNFRIFVLYYNKDTNKG